MLWRKNTVFTLCFLLLSAEIAVAADTSARSASDLNVAMASIGVLMSDLLSQKVLDDPEVVLKKLDQLETRFQQTESHAGEHGPAFRISWAMLAEQIGRSRDAINSGLATPDTLRNLVHGIASACAGCHTQDDKIRVLSAGKLTLSTADPLQQARFQYITRNYAEALSLYDLFLDRQVSLARNGPVLDALEGELTIFGQIYRDPDRAIKHLKKRLARSSGTLTRGVRQDIEAWIQGFEEVRKAKLKAFKASFADIQGYVNTYILPHAGEPIVVAEKDKVSYLWMRGVLHEYIQSHPEDSRMPDLLYWLAISDRVLDYNFYYSLADMYLRECIVRYPTTDAAELCFSEYERYVEFAYSGSSGEHVPAEIQDEVLRLREIIDTARAAAEVPAGASNLLAP